MTTTLSGPPSPRLNWRSLLGRIPAVERRRGAAESRKPASAGRPWNVLCVDAGGCGLTTAELRSLLAPEFALERHGLGFADCPEHADVMLVTGPVTTAMGPVLRDLHAAMPLPRRVLTVGDCARDGCVFAGAYGILEGTATLFPVADHVPGCPPRPEAILEGLLRVRESRPARHEAASPAS